MVKDFFLLPFHARLQRYFVLWVQVDSAVFSLPSPLSLLLKFAMFLSFETGVSVIQVSQLTSYVTLLEAEGGVEVFFRRLSVDF